MEKQNNDSEMKQEKNIKVECGIEVDGCIFDNEHIVLQERTAHVLYYLYNLAWETDLKGLDKYDDAEQFDAWLKQHHPKVAKILVDAAENHIIECLNIIAPDSIYHHDIPYLSPSNIDDCYWPMPGLEYRLYFYEQDIPQWM